MAGNLLSALASALGAGIQGYGRQSMLNDENRRRDEEMEVLRQDRAAMRQQQMLEQLRRNAESGIFQGEAPRGKEQLIGALQSSFLPQGLTIDNEQRFRQVAPGWHQDFAQSEMGREIAGRQAQARVKSDADFAKRQEGNEARALKSQEITALTDLVEQGLGGNKRAQAGAIANKIPASTFDRDKPTQGEMDRPGRLRQQWIDMIVASKNGVLWDGSDKPSVAGALRSDPALRAQAEKYKVTPEEWNAAANNWKSGKGGGMARTEALEGKAAEEEESRKRRDAFSARVQELITRENLSPEEARKKALEEMSPAGAP